MRDEYYSVLLEADDDSGAYVHIYIDKRGNTRHEFYEKDGDTYSKVSPKPNAKTGEPAQQSAYAGIFE